MEGVGGRNRHTAHLVEHKGLIVGEVYTHCTFLYPSFIFLQDFAAFSFLTGVKGINTYSVESKDNFSRETKLIVN
jgi:hypothetical protein